MKKLTYLGLLCASIPLLFSEAVIAQVIPDSSLAVESSVVVPRSTNGQPTELIEGGATRGGNLFHSFESFSIPTGQGVYFANPNGVNRIFSRVTGHTISDIQGVLGILGNADLFFINSNGISFGPDAQLQLSGSFVASTANSVEFADSIELSTSSSRSPLLSSSIPIGLGLSGNSSITVNNTGRDVVGNIFSDNLSVKRGLAVAPFQSLALIGNNIDINGGILRTPDGLLTLTGVQEGTVNLSSSLNLSYPDAVLFGDVRVSQLSLLDASGFSGGKIRLYGRNIDLSDGSIVLIRTFGGGNGAIDIGATESLQIGRSDRPEPLVSAILSQNLGAGRGADIFVETPQLVVQNGGQIISNTFNSGSSGNILINAPNFVRVDGFSSFSEDIPSSITTGAFGQGSSGRFTLNAGDVLVSAGGQIGSIAGSGSPGDVDITARNITVEGSLPTLLKPSFLGIATAGRGNAEQLSITTDVLRVLFGGAVGTSSIGSGNAGNTSIRASTSIEVRGSFPGAVNPSIIDSSATAINPITRIVTRLTSPSPLIGNAGSVFIVSPKLTVSDGGAIRVQNDGSGDAGNLQIVAAQLQIAPDGRISAATRSGQGGSILLQSNSLAVFDRARISASAGGNGQGGNITIHSDAIALAAGSSITANAAQGTGGRVLITTDALLRSPTSLITATSAVGPELDGTVDIQSPNETIRVETEAVPQAIGLPEVSAACISSSEESSEFVVTGRGGVPRSPTSIQQNYSGWRSPSTPSSAIELNRAPQITEAQGWISNNDGTVSFTEQPANPIYASAQNTGCVSSTAQKPS